MPLRAARTRETTPTRGGKHPPAVLVLILSWKKKLTTPHRRQHARLNAHVQGWTHSVPNTHSTSTLFQPSLGTLSWRIPLPLPVLVLNSLQGFPLWEMSSPLLPWTHLSVLTWHSQNRVQASEKHISLASHQLCALSWLLPKQKKISQQLSLIPPLSSVKHCRT